MTVAAPALVAVPRDVAVAAAATTVGMLPVFFGFSQDSLPTGALFCAGWPALGLAAAVLLDREPGHRIGRTMVLLAVLPAALVLTAVLTTGPARRFPPANDSEAARDRWRTGASSPDTVLAFVLLTLDDAEAHRRRLEGRVRSLAHIPPRWLAAGGR